MSDNNQKMLLEAESDFGLSLLRHQLSNESLVFSPISIGFALSMIRVGALGNTRTQLTNILGKDAKDEDIDEYYSNISKSLLQATHGIQVNSANRLFIKDGFEIKAEYLEEIQKRFDAVAQNLNFSNADESAQIINKFVSDTTHEKIPFIIKPSAIDDLLVAILVNALYFKGTWQNKFKSSATFDETFAISDSENRTIPFLHASKVHRKYAENEDWQVISLPYKDNTYALNIFLPKERYGLKDAVSRLTATSFQDLLSNVTENFVSISLPKYSINTQLALKEVLEKIGIVDAFSQSADFSNIASGIFVSKVTHKALIEVDEEGTTAAAVTAMEFSLKAAPFFPKDPIIFKADHPYLFALTLNNHPLFLGVFQ